MSRDSHARMNEDGLWVHPAYFVRSDAPERHPKEERRGKRYGAEGDYYEVRRHGDGWTTFHVFGGEAVPDARAVFRRRMFYAAELALARFAQRCGLREVPR